MRLIANMVVKDEADRYLDAALSALEGQVDEIFVGNDLSSDASEEIALSHGATVYTRCAEDKNFIQAEGTFRSNCWDAMVDVFQPTSDDWILGIDADQFAVGRPIKTLAAEAHRQGYVAVNLRVPEIFCLNPVAERVDGYWGGITGTFLMRFNPDASQKFRQEGMGCGMFPEYAYMGKNWNERKESGVRILHLGYAHELDRHQKFNRYASLANNGHASSHIESILRPPRLVQWEGELPEIWRGVK